VTTLFNDARLWRTGNVSGRISRIFYGDFRLALLLVDEQLPRYGR